MYRQMSVNHDSIAHHSDTLPSASILVQCDAAIGGSWKPIEIISSCGRMGSKEVCEGVWDCTQESISVRT